MENEKLKKILTPLLGRLNNLQPVMRTIAGIMANAVEENFETEGKHTIAGGWKQLAKVTIRERIRIKKWPGKILNRHGASGLVGSITQSYGDNFAVVGTNKVYAAIHQYGGSINHAERSEIFTRLRKTKGKNKGKFKKLAEDRPIAKGFKFKSYTTNIPARPFLVLAPSDLTEISTAISNYLHK